VIHYYLKEQPQGEVTLTFLSASGQVIRTFSSEERRNSHASGLDKTKTKTGEREEGAACS